MKISYKICQSEYEKLLLLTLRRAERSPGRLLAFALLTAGQMGWVAYMLATSGLPVRDNVILGGCSAALALINIVFRALRPVRARRALKSIIASGQIVPDYWKTHSLSVSSGCVRLSFGSVRLELPCGDIHTEENSGLLLLHSSGKLFDAVPLSAFASEEEKSELRRAVETPVSADVPEEAPEGAEFSQRWSCDGRDYLSAQVGCYRSVFLRRSMTKPFQLLKLAASAYMLYYAAFKAEPIVGLLLTVFVIFINLTLLIAVTPAARFYLLRKAPQLSVPPERTMEQVFSVDHERVYLGVNGRVYAAPVQDVSLCRAGSRGVIVYAGTWPAAAIPLSAFSGREEAERLCAYVNARAGIMSHT